jgi:hypothetical protein
MLKRTLALTLALVALMFGVATQATAETLVAFAYTGTFEGNRLLTFDSATPGTINTNVAVSGLGASEILLGIDYRPANGLLYGITSQSRLYTLDPLTGVAVFASQLSTSLSNPFNSSFGVDFDPLADRLRVVSSDDQNLRVNVDTGETVADGSINPASRRITASAYTNNFAGATSTTLYGIENGSNPGFLVIQNPSTGTVTDVGPLGASSRSPLSFTGFDISGQTGIAYAALVFNEIGATQNLYTINLVTGRATLVGTISDGRGCCTFTGLAAPVSSSPNPILVRLSRNASNQLQATITLSNPLADPLPGVTMTLVRASTLDGSAFVDGEPVPQAFGTINPGQSVTATVTFPGTAGVPSGFSGLVRVDLSYTGGTYTETEQVVTP